MAKKPTKVQAEEAAAAAAAATAEQLPTQPAGSTEAGGPEETAAAESTPVPPTTDSSQEEPKGIPGLVIRSVPASFRRCGFRFDRAGVGIALDALTDEQVEQLHAEPNLVIEPGWLPDDEQG